MSDTIPLAAGSGVPEPDLAQKFLGLRASEVTEFTLLGVAPGTATRDNVLNALRAQLARVAQHPEAGSREASQVRVMLHAAAARLLGPVLASDAPAAREEARSAPVAPPTALEDAAVRILAMHGGMNHVSLKMIRQTAGMMDVGNDELSQVLMKLPQLVGAAEAAAAPKVEVAAARKVEAVGPARGIENARTHTHASDDEPMAAEEIRRVEMEDPTKRLIAMAVLGIVGGLVLLGGVAYGVRIIFTKTPAPTPIVTQGGAEQAALAPVAAPDAVVKADVPKQQPEPTRVRTPEELVMALRDSVARSRSDAQGGADAIIAATREIGAVWQTMPRDYLVASGDAFVDAMYAVQHDDGALRRVLESLRETAGMSRDALDEQGGRVAQMALARSLLARLLVERDLPASARGVLRDAAAAGLVSESATRGPWADNLYDATSATGRLLAESAAQPSEQPPEEAWKTLVACIRAATPEVERQEAAILTILDHLMTQGKEPTQDARVLAGVQTLANALDWSAPRGARGSLVVWLGRADVSSADAAALTAVVATKSEAEADRTFALSPGASDQDRLDLRDRFANLWQTQTAGARRDLALAWVQQAEGALGAPAASSTMDAMREAVRFASLNAGAARVWRGEAAGGLVTTPVPSGNGPSAAQVMDTLLARSGGTWALDYLRAGPDMLRRRDLLKGYTGEPGPLEAKLLVIDAMRGPTQDIRVQARRTLTQSLQSPVVAAAMLDFAPFMPPTREVSQLVMQATGRTLPAPRSPMWRVEVRRALVWKLLGQLDDGTLSETAQAEQLLASVYQQRLSTTSNATLAAGEAIARAFDEATLDAQSAMRMRGQSAAVTQIRTMLREKLRTAEGEPQRFVAYQTGIVELLAAALMTEKPALRERVEGILAEWRREMSQAPHVMRQMERAERMQTRLWTLRMKEES
jgi:hypothetical protein